MGLSFLFNGVPELPGNISENGLTSSHEKRGPKGEVSNYKAH